MTEIQSKSSHPFAVEVLYRLYGCAKETPAGPCAALETAKHANLHVPATTQCALASRSLPRTEAVQSDLLFRPGQWRQLDGHQHVA
jgi:hypothetical protein